MDNDEINPDQPLPGLTASFTMKRGFFRRERITASVYALSENGCVIKTDENFEAGDELRLALSLEMPFENASTPALAGQVTRSRKYCSNFFYTFDFYQGSRSSAADDIQRLLDLIERKVALTHRRRTGSKRRTPPARMDMARTSQGI